MFNEASSPMDQDPSNTESSIWIRQGKIVDSSEIAGLWTVSLAGAGGTPVSEFGRKVAITMTDDEYKRINENSGVIGPDSPLELVKVGDRLYTLAAKK